MNNSYNYADFIGMNINSNKTPSIKPEIRGEASHTEPAQSSSQIQTANTKPAPKKNRKTQ